jgi:syntaxin 16
VEAGAGAGAGGGRVGRFDHAIPPGWLAAVDDVHYEIERIKAKLSELAKAHKEHLLPQFSDADAGEQTVEILTEQVTKLFRDAKTRALKIGGSGVVAEEEVAMKKNLQSALAQELQKLSMQFRHMQKDYLQSLASRQKRGGALFNFHDESIDEDFAPGAFDVEFSEEQRAALVAAHANVDEREREIRNIARSINDLAEIFRDLATLVAEQGTVLDRIDYNIEEAHHHVEKAVVELGKAQHQQKKYTKKLCMMLLCVMILVMLIIVTIMGFVRIGGDSSSSSSSS